MVQVEVNENTGRLLIMFGITSQQAEEAVNNRDKAILDPGLNRLIAVRWISEDEAIVVDSEVTGKHMEGNEVVIERVRIMLALRINSSLPAGRINRDSELEPLMLTVAESFGQPISFHPTAAPVVLYTGPWQQNHVQISDTAEAGHEILVLATASPTTQSVFGGWAFNLTKYVAWLKAKQVEEPFESIRITEHNSPWRPTGDDNPITFSGDFISDSLRKFGIKKEQAAEVIGQPDRTDELEFYGFKIRLHFKALQTQPPSGLLVTESVDEGRRVDFAFRIYPQLGEEIQDLRPLEILRSITNSFGFLQRVGAQTGKLILGERFDFSGQIVEGMEQPRGSMIFQVYFKVNEGPLPKAYVALAYSIDTDLYSNWLKSVARTVN